MIVDICQSNNRKDKTRQDKTRQDKTRQDKVGHTVKARESIEVQEL